MSRILDFLVFITWRKACANRKGVSFLTRLYHIGHLNSGTAVENTTKGSILTLELKNALVDGYSARPLHSGCAM